MLTRRHVMKKVHMRFGARLQQNSVNIQQSLKKGTFSNKLQRQFKDTSHVQLRSPLKYYCLRYTEWRTKCHTIDCARNKFLLL